MSHFVNITSSFLPTLSFRDLFVVWARCKWDQKVRGFLIEKVRLFQPHLEEIYLNGSVCLCTQGTKGLAAPAIKNKLALRCSLTGSIFLDSVKVSHDALLPGVQGLRGPFGCLNSARYVPLLIPHFDLSIASILTITFSYGISWGAMGALEDCIARTRAYALERQQFDRPLASFQLVQKKLTDAHTEVTLGLLASLQVGRLKDAGKAAPEMISMVKRNNCGKALEHVRRVLDILGGNACSDEYVACGCDFMISKALTVCAICRYHVGRHAANLQVVNTYEGTYVSRDSCCALLWNLTRPFLGHPHADSWQGHYRHPSLRINPNRPCSYPQNVSKSCTVHKDIVINLTFGNHRLRIRCQGCCDCGNRPLIELLDRGSYAPDLYYSGI